MILILDNFDSFTYNLVDYFHQLSIETRVIRNNVSLGRIKEENYQGIVLSPGPGRPESSGCLMEVIDEYHMKLPMLGICLGHQALGEFFGSGLIKAERPMHGKRVPIRLELDPLFQGIKKTIDVVRYHSLMIKPLSPELMEIATTKDGVLMALRHRALPIHGVQFHPEAVLTECGLEILSNWVNINKIK